MVILGFFLETDVEYSKQLGLPSNDLLFISKKMRIGKQENLVCNLNDKKKNIVEDIQITLSKNSELQKNEKNGFEKVSTSA